MKRRPSRLSTKGAQFIARWEGLRTEPYDDPVGFATIGIGHLLHRSRVTLADRRRWRGFKRTDAYALLVKDSERYAAPLRAFLTRWNVRLNQPQFDALVSFTFNVGPGWINSSGLRRALIRAGQSGKVGDTAKAEVRRELMQWNKAGGHALAGLTRRREAEARLFATGRYAPAPKRTPKKPAGSIAGTHFTWNEARSHDGKAVPLRYRRNAIRHARNLEKLRTAINRARARHGLKPTGIHILSWYRSPEQNARVGGARASRHMSADATDISLQEITRLCPWHGGRSTFEALADQIFKAGGFGQYPGGNRHVDSRGYRARWTSWTR